MTWLLLHGFTGGPSTFDAVRSGRDDAAWLAPTVGGHGLPPAPIGEDFWGEVDRLAAPLLASGLRDVGLCGYSQGARLGLGLLVRHPALFRRAVLVGVNPGLAPMEAAPRAAADDALADTLERDGLERFMEVWATQPLFASQARLPAEVRAQEQRRRRRHDARALATSLRRLSLGRMPDLRGALSGLRVPVTFVAGAQDEKFAAIARRCAEAMPGARVELVAESGHNVVLERPDAIASLLEREST